MIDYLKHNEIDREQWDNCISNSPGVKPYAYSWYLDIMAPGWEAMVDDEYESVFPIPANTRFGIRYIATPIFLQQLGVFSPDKPAAQKILEFIEYLPDFYRLIDLCVGQKVISDGFRLTQRTNYELDLSKPYEKLWEGFTSDCRRNINLAAKKKIELTEKVTPADLINLFMLNKGMIIKGIKLRDYDRLENLMNYCIRNNKGKIIGVRSARKKLIFGVFLVQLKKSITILFTANSIESRNKRTGYFVINEIIKENSSKGTILDFAGSSIPSVASFMESFGSINKPYYRIYRNRLFWPIRIMK
jgi:hypothetical protein